MSWSRSNGGRVLRGVSTETLERATLTVPKSTLANPAGSLDVAGLEKSFEDPVALAYEAGRKEGRDEAVAELEADASKRRQELLGEMSASLKQAADSLEHNRQIVLDELVEDVSGLVFELVREIVGTELSLSSEPARDAVARALRAAPANTDLIVRLHPGAAIAAWELESLAPGRRVRVLEDESVELNGCVLEVGSTTIDAQVGPALERLREALSHVAAHTHGEEEAS